MGRKVRFSIGLLEFPKRDEPVLTYSNQWELVLAKEAITQCLISRKFDDITNYNELLECVKNCKEGKSVFIDRFYDLKKVVVVRKWSYAKKSKKSY